MSHKIFSILYFGTTGAQKIERLHCIHELFGHIQVKILLKNLKIIFSEMEYSLHFVFFFEQNATTKFGKICCKCACGQIKKN